MNAVPGLSGTGNDSADPQSPSAAAGGGIGAGSCAGFKNSTGINGSTITIGNAADISGPIPGLFTAAQVATKAYVAYFNAVNPGGICGRKLQLVTQDTRTDAGADQAAYTKLCEQVFAAVGSLSAFDSGGAKTANDCGLVDLRAVSTTAARNDCRTCFGAQSTGRFEYTNSFANYFLKSYPEASRKAALLYIKAGAAAETALTQQKVNERRGIKYLYVSPIDVADFNYGPYVQQMKSRGVEFVQFIGAQSQSVRLAQAMQSADFNPQLKVLDQSADDPAFYAKGGKAVDGFTIVITYNPLSDNQRELNLYKQWLQQVSPGSVATPFGMFAWSAAKLFTEHALALGGKLTRPALAARLRTVRAWTGGGMHGPMDVGGKHAPACIRLQQVRSGALVPIGPSRFICDGITKVG